MTTRGTSNSNARGGTHDRRRRRAWVLATFQVASTLDGRPLVACFDCETLLDEARLTIDRIVPACFGGTYVRSNLRPACMGCNIRAGNEARALKRRLTGWRPPRHKPGCRHCRTVLEYRMARHAAELQREAVTAGYATETAAYGPLITFKEWLIQTSAARHDDYQEQAA